MNDLEILSTSWILKEPSFKNISRDFIIKKISENFQSVLNFMIEIDIENLQQILLIELAIHPSRIEFNKNNPLIFIKSAHKIIRSSRNLIKQFEYYLFLNNDCINHFPNILKKIWSQYLSTATDLHIIKKNSKVNIIDVIRVCHASPLKNPQIKELLGEMKFSKIKGTGKIKSLDYKKLRLEKKSWIEIMNLIELSSKDILDNIFSMFHEINDIKILEKIINKLQDIKPHECYKIMYKTYFTDEIKKKLLIDGLTKSIETSLDKYPVLKGSTLCLCDISNLNYDVNKLIKFSGLLMCYKSELRSTIGLFNEELSLHEINKSISFMNQLQIIDTVSYKRNNENGLKLFFDEALNDPELNMYDNLIIFSDKQLSKNTLISDDGLINLQSHLESYKTRVNQNVNIFLVDVTSNKKINSTYRNSCLYGIKGSEIFYIEKMIQFWNLS